MPYSIHFFEFMLIFFSHKKTDKNTLPFSYHAKMAVGIKTGAQSINTETEPIRNSNNNSDVSANYFITVLFTS